MFCLFHCVHTESAVEYYISVLKYGKLGDTVLFFCWNWLNENQYQFFQLGWDTRCACVPAHSLCSFPSVETSSLDSLFRLPSSVVCVLYFHCYVTFVEVSIFACYRSARRSGIYGISWSSGCYWYDGSSWSRISRTTRTSGINRKYWISWANWEYWTYWKDRSTWWHGHYWIRPAG